MAGTKVPRISDIANTEVFTTGQVARICNVAVRTAAKWIDAGKLKGYQLPGSTDRRVYRRDLIDFMQAHGLRSDLIAPPVPRVLLIGLDNTAADAMRVALEAAGIRVHRTGNGYDGIAVAADLEPDSVVIDLAMGRIDSAMTARTLKSFGRVKPYVIGLGAISAQPMDIDVYMSRGDAVRFLIDRYGGK